MNRTDIEYLDFTWNPVVGCGYGCSYCWARRQAKRQKHNCRKCYAFAPHLHPERLDEPLKKRKPWVIGAVFMGDLFDPAFVLNPIFRWTGKFAPEAVLEIMDEADWHTFVLLTKQPQLAKRFAFPPNVVLGVSVEDQASADRRIPELMKCPAAKRIVSIEPMRGAVDLSRFLCDHASCEDWGLCRGRERDLCSGEGRGLDGVILGGQTGAGAPPMHPDWVRKVRDQCPAAGVPFFFKGWGKHIPKDHGVAGVPWMVGSKGRVLDGRTHDEVAWTKGGKA